VKVNDDEVILETQEQCSPPCQTLIFCFKIKEETHAPFIGSDIPKTKACKLPNVQGKPKNKNKKKNKLNASSFAIANVTKEFVKKRCEKNRNGKDGND
jgi:hypothetical protein